MSDGQLAMNTNTASPGLFFKDSNGDSVKVGPVHVGTTAPNVTPGAGGQAGNSKGELWLDTTGGTYVLKTWDGTAWRSVSLTGDFVETTGDTMTGALVMDDQGQVRFREATANGTSYVALQAAASVASNKTITLPDATGTVVLSGAIDNADISASAAIALSKLATGALPSAITIASANIVDGSIVNADINASAAIADTKLGTISTAGKISDSALPATISSNITGSSASCTGNAATATNLSSNRTFALTGDVTGSVSSNLSSGMSIATTVAAAGLLVSAGAVGAYQIARNAGGSRINAGGTITGAGLQTAGGDSLWGNPAFGGTWRLMGGPNEGGSDNGRSGLWQRIA
jgi:hypothetical protein